MAGRPRKALPFTGFVVIAWMLGIMLTAFSPSSAAALPADLTGHLQLTAPVSASAFSHDVRSMQAASAASQSQRQYRHWIARRRAEHAAAVAAAAAASQPSAPPVTGGMPPAAFTQCVVTRESGGDPTAYNTSSGASGLFGMEPAFWASISNGYYARLYPGGAYTAPSSVQYAAFDAAYAADGTSPWEPYDGCSVNGPAALHAKLLSSSRAVLPRMRAFEWVVNNAKGCWYDYGGTSCAPGYDCSGLVMTAYEHAGIQLPRTTYDMLGSWHLVRISPWQARKGDLAFFGSGHVEMVSYRDQWTIGARDWGLRVESRHNVYWKPTAYYRVR